MARTPPYVDLSPRPLREAPARRLPQLFAGLALYGASCALLIRGALGLDPWDVLHQGLHNHTGLSYGTVIFGVSVLVLLLWIPLRQRPGFGTVANVVVISVTTDLTLWLLPPQHGLAIRAALTVGGVVLNGLATASYVGARLGPGPRDGLMTGLAARTGRSIRLVRTCIELVVLVVGFTLGGGIGLGTVLYAFGIGPLTQFFLPLVAWRRTGQKVPPTPGAHTAGP